MLSELWAATEKIAAVFGQMERPTLKQTRLGNEVRMFLENVIDLLGEFLDRASPEQVEQLRNSSNKR
jgi:hypothetical protein